jgi:hypothetical protein
LATPRADAHPVTRALLSGGPVGFAGAARVASVAPDATPLLVHPSLTVEAGAEHSPVVAVRRVGAGRVLVVATDTVWRLGFPALASGGDPERLAVFWDRALAWLVGEAGGALAVETDGRAVHVTGGRAGEDVEATLEYRAGGHALQRLALDANGAATLRATGEIASARARSVTSGEERVAFNPGPEGGDERSGVARGDAVLRALVARCGGSLARGDDAAARVARGVERAGVARRMARPWVALALALVGLTALGLEWFVRRTRGAR